MKLKDAFGEGKAEKEKLTEEALSTFLMGILRRRDKAGGLAGRWEVRL